MGNRMWSIERRHCQCP